MSRQNQVIIQAVNPGQQTPTPDSSKRDSLLLLVPCAVQSALAEPRIARWLAKSHAIAVEPHATALDRVLALLNYPAPKSAQAALRYWGDSGEKPGDWIATADPVWMQAGMDKLFLQVPPPGDIDPDGLRDLFADLNEQLFAAAPEALCVINDRGYLCGGSGMETARVPADAIAGEQPDDWLPAGPSAERYLSLSGELQMAMHEHPVNRQRESAGKVPLNALWLWGGGHVVDEKPEMLPPIVADDPLLRGYGYLNNASVSNWQGNLKSLPPSCIALAGLETAMQALADAALQWQQKEVHAMTVLFTDVRCEFARGLAAWFNRRGPEKLPEVAA